MPQAQGRELLDSEGVITEHAYAHLEVPVGLQCEGLTDIDSFTCHLGHLELVDAVLVTVIAHLQAQVLKLYFAMKKQMCYCFFFADT